MNDIMIGVLMSMIGVCILIILYMLIVINNMMTNTRADLNILKYDITKLKKRYP